MGLGLPMGPLTLLDLIGLDTSLAVLEVLQAEFGGSRYLPAGLLRKLRDARLFGRKSGRGFYDYRHAPAAAAEAQPPVPLPAEVAVISDAGGVLEELASEITAVGISVVPQPSPETGLVIVAADPKHRVLDAALAAGHPADVVGIHFIDPDAGLKGLTEWVLPDVTAAGTAAKATALAAKLGLNTITSRDRPGFLVELGTDTAVRRRGPAASAGTRAVRARPPRPRSRHRPRPAACRYRRRRRLRYWARRTGPTWLWRWPTETARRSSAEPTETARRS